MVRVFRPGWDDLREILESARRQVFLCSPFISATGVDRVFDALVELGEAVEVHILTRLSPTDWQLGISDPEELVDALEALSEEGFDVTLSVCNRLHAKLYAVDVQSGLVGSANLTTGGFSRNVELMVEIEGQDVEIAVREVLSGCDAANRKVVDIERLRVWVDRYRDLVARAALPTTTMEEELADAQRDLLHDVLEQGGSEIRTPIDQAGLDAFMAWLETNENLPGAAEILSRHHNARRQNLTGHVKQSFYGASTFLMEHPRLVPTAAAAIDEADQDDVPEIDDAVLGEWIQYLEDHGGAVGPDYDFAVLTNILPPILGGTRSGGGGASSTFKRMLALVARYQRR